MWTPPTPGRQTPSREPQEGGDDLGGQLEDLLAHVLKCERWAAIDDRITLSLAVEQATRRRQNRKR